MSRHITDHAAPKSEGTRTKTFLEMDRQSGVHPAVRELSQRAPLRGDAKTKEFLRIDREQDA